MQTLATFYHSPAWRKLVARLRLERVNEDGLIICEHCGKPITRAYDCIGHHVIELTNDNVNDPEIALNPDNVKLIHFKCHNAIHERWQGTKYKVFLVYGAPCAGKSTWVQENANPDDLIVDIDRIWDCLSLGGWKQKTKRLTANVFGVRDLLLDQIRTRTGMWRNAYIIGGYPLATDRQRLCGILRARPVFIEATFEECMERAKEKPDGWCDHVRDWFDAYTE